MKILLKFLFGRKSKDRGRHHCVDEDFYNA